MFLMSSSDHLAEYQGIYVPRIIAAQVVEPARLAIIREPLGIDGWNFAHKSLKPDMKVCFTLQYINSPLAQLSMVGADNSNVQQAA